MTSTLARVDTFLSGTHVFDGAGILDETGRQRAEAAAVNLSSKIGAPVYIDVAVGGADPAGSAFFNAADISNGLGRVLVIALGVHGDRIG